jgi:hypothetical protein
MPVPREVRRRIGRLVRRDAMRAYGTALILYMAGTIWLVRVWPPGDLRRMFWAAAPSDRADVAVLLVALHTAVTVPVARTLLASRRLEVWRALPLPPRFWRLTSASHLLTLHATFVAALIYGGLAQPGWPTWVGVLALALAGPVLHVGALALHDRRIAARVAAPIAALGMWVIARWCPPIAAAGLATIGAGWAWHRVGTVFPERIEASSVARWRPRTAAGAWAWLLIRVALRRHPRAIASLVVAQLALVALTAVAHAYVQHDPPAIAGLVRVAGLLAVGFGAVVLPVAMRAIERDRPLLDALPLTPSREWRGRLVIAAVGTAPACVGLAATSAMAVDPVRVLAEVACACAWAVAEAERFTANAEARRRIDELPAKRGVAFAALAWVLVVLAGTCAILLPWIAAALWAGPRRLRGLRTIRGRKQSARPDDDHG